MAVERQRAESREQVSHEGEVSNVGLRSLTVRVSLIKETYVVYGASASFGHG